MHRYHRPVNHTSHSLRIAHNAHTHRRRRRDATVDIIRNWLTTTADGCVHSSHRRHDATRLAVCEFVQTRRNYRHMQLVANSVYTTPTRLNSTDASLRRQRYVLGLTYCSSLISVRIHNAYVHAFTPCPEKKSLEYFRHNFIKYWPIFEIRSLLHSAENLQ